MLNFNSTCPLIKKRETPKVSYKEIALFLDLRGLFPESAHPLVKEYVRVTRELVMRSAWDDNMEYEGSGPDRRFVNMPDEELAQRSKELFKIIYLKYGHLRNTEPGS